MVKTFHTVKCLPLTARTHVQSRNDPYGICGGQRVTGIVSVWTLLSPPSILHALTHPSLSVTCETGPDQPARHENLGSHLWPSMVVGANLCVPRPLEVKDKGIRGVSQRQHFVARCLSSYVGNVLVHVVNAFVFLLPTSEAHCLIPATVFGSLRVEKLTFV
jgi:hypothetical protein